MGGLNDFGGMPIIEDPLCPPGMAYILNDDMIVMSTPPLPVRHRFWYKPWTWRRKNDPGGWPWTQVFGAVKVTGLDG